MFLSDKMIREAQPKAKPYKLSDGDGLYLCVQPCGSKLWRLKYRFMGKANTLAIGKYTLVSLAEARDERHEAKKLLRVNIDPNERKKEAKRKVLLDCDNSFGAIAQAWLNFNNKKWVPEHALRVQRRLELHALPHIGKRPIVHIKTPELVVVLRKLEKQHKPETAVRLTQTLNAVFRYAVHIGLLEHNPATNLFGIIAPHQQKHFAAIHVSELPQFFRKLNTVATSERNRIAIKLLMHTFVRPGELRHSKWSEINWDAKAWHIPTERMKMRRPHTVPLSEPALALLRELQAITGYSDYLFPSQQRRRHPVMSENTINKILKNMGYGGKQVGHGFRAIASTVLNESALFRPDVIEMQLAHIEKNSSRKPYNRAEYLQERTEMMAWWSNYLIKAYDIVSENTAQKCRD